MLEHKLKIIFNEIFQISLITYLILLIAESFREGFVSMYFDLNILLGIIVVSGIVISVLGNSHNHANMKAFIKPGDEWFIPSMAAIITGVLVYLKIQSIGMLSIFISIIAAVISFYLSYLTLIED